MSYNGFLPPFGRDYRYPTPAAVLTLGINNQTGLAWYIPGFDGTVDLWGAHFIDPAGDSRSFPIASGLPATSSYAWRPSSSYDVITEGGGSYMLMLSLSNSSQVNSLAFNILDAEMKSDNTLSTDPTLTLQTATISRTGSLGSTPSLSSLGSGSTSTADPNASATTSQSPTRSAASGQENVSSNASSLSLGAVVAIAVVATILAAFALWLASVFYGRRRSRQRSQINWGGIGGSRNDGRIWRRQPTSSYGSNNVYEKDAANITSELGSPLPHEMDSRNPIIPHN